MNQKFHKFFLHKSVCINAGRGEKELLCTLLTLLDLRRFDCANKQPKNLSLKQVELASRSLSMSLLVEVSGAAFLKVGNIAPLWANEKHQEEKSKRGRKRRRGR